MKDKAKRECLHIRRTLQELHDATEEPRGNVAEHLLHCRECAAFETFLEDLPRNLRGTLQEATARLPAADYTRATARAPQRHSLRHSQRIALAAIAAGFLALAVPASLLTFSAVRERAAMQETVTIFVNDLFRSSFDEKAEYHKAVSSPSGEALDSLLNDLAAD